MAVRWANVDAGPTSTNPDEEAWAAAQSRWTQGWRRFVLPVVFLAYLVYVGQAVAQHSHGADATGGYVVLGVFVACYLAILLQGTGQGAASFWASWKFWVLYGLLVACLVAVLPFAHAAGFVLALYITAITVGRLGVRAAPIAVLLAIAALLVPVAVSSWHDSLSSAFDSVVPLAIPVVAIVTFAFVRVQRGNLALAEARAEIARLSAEGERSRIARDLHDLLGHSLTTITVKAGLAHRLGTTDPARAVEEIAEVEDLSRQALADVRAAVSNYREVTLAGELARGRYLLEASGIEAELPAATDVVGSAHQELFGWAVREGITNVARHARATRCTVTLGSSEVQICDDGIGGPAGSGNGLAGLRERVVAAGGTVEAGPLSPRGWRLRVALEPGLATPS